MEMFKINNNQNLKRVAFSLLKDISALLVLHRVPDVPNLRPQARNRTIAEKG